MNSTVRKFLRLLSLASVLALPSVGRAELITVSGNLTGTNVWHATNEYLLNGYVYVLTNSVLRIEAGTVVRGTPGAPPNFGVLFITQGAQLYAEGTPSRPIIFTAQADDLTDPGDLPFPSRGLWGGIVLLGRGPINNAVTAAGNAATPKYDVYEGMPDTMVAGQGIHRFGGADPDDNSGAIRYVSIRHGGALLESNKEINGLSFGGVGRGTTVEFVEAYCIADDGFEFFGGTVNTRNLVSAFNDDDAFDADQGYTGKNQFWFGIQEDGKRDEGAELNGEPNDNATGTGVPVSRFEVYNATLIGAGALGGSGNDGFTIRQYTQTQWYNGIYTEFNGQPFNSGSFLTGSQPTFGDNVWWNFSNPVWQPESVFANPAVNSTNVNPQIRSISRTPDGGLDPRLGLGSPALDSPRTPPSDGFYQPVKYYGAFGTNNLWIQGWTALSAEGFLTPRTNLVVITNQFLTGEINWSATNVYLLTNYVYLMTNAVLHIEPGTVIKGRNGSPPNFGALFVTQGARIYAEGSPSQPIIFTAEADDLDDPGDLPFPSRGLWGGIVLLGRGPINNAVTAAGNAATPKYDVYEGMPDTMVAGQGIHRFGGADPDDNSGAIRYVSIRHGGALLESNKEINGLSFGGVGRGTTVEFVEAYCIADDGFEFFGGTVNTRNLVSAFNDDDAFDADQGYTGKNQFWFGIQEDGKRDEGAELNGEPNDNATGTGVPVSRFEVYNATLIGAGALGGSGNDGFTIRQYTQTQWYNGIYTEFNGQPFNSGSFLTGSQPTFGDNVWWNFSNPVWQPESVFANPAVNSTNVNPQIRSISRTPDGGLDPRLGLNSPALNSPRTPPSDGFYQPVKYYGAFGTGLNWAVDWTALAAEGFFNGAGGGTVVSPPTVAGPALTSTLIDNSIVIGLASETGRSYLLESRSALGTGTWAADGDPVAGTGEAISFTRPADAGERFYQVKVE